MILLFKQLKHEWRFWGMGLSQVIQTNFVICFGVEAPSLPFDISCCEKEDQAGFGTEN